MNDSSARTPTHSSQGIQALILESDEKLAAEIVSALTEAAPGTKVGVARSLSEAQQLAVEQRPSLFVLDVDTAYDRAQEFIYDLRTSHPGARAIILTAMHFSAQRDQVAGLGAIHFLEKPFPRADFMTLAETLLAPGEKSEGERFQGTLSDLHIADIIQLKCISGATSMLEFTGPKGEKARVYFENGQVRHASAPGKEGMAAFNAIVDWKGGKISEVPVTSGMPRTIDLDWQVLLMEAVRNMDESQSAKATTAQAISPGEAKTILVIDDSAMLLSFVEEILEEQNYKVVTAATAEEGLTASRSSSPDLILLDFILPDMKGDEVCRKLVADPATSQIPVVYVSGFGSDLQADPAELPNVIGALNKPFTSETLIDAVKRYLPEQEAAPPETQPSAAMAAPSPPVGMPVPPAANSEVNDDSLGKEKLVETEPQESPTPVNRTPVLEPAATVAPTAIIEPEAQSSDNRSSKTLPSIDPVPAPSPTDAAVMKKAPESVTSDHGRGLRPAASVSQTAAPDSVAAPAPAAGRPKSAVPPSATSAYFCGDSSFFSLNWALQTIASERLTGVLHAFWSRDSVELLAREGQIVVVTSRNPSLYCEETPVTLLNVDQEKIEAARARQTKEGCPIFLTLAEEGLILREPGLQLVQHHGQRLFSQLWTDRVRFTFEQQPLPAFSQDLPVAEDRIDQWALSTLRFVQYEKLRTDAMPETSSIPAYTRDGIQRVQDLRLTVAEAQFASQFNGTRSVAQISKNLRIDIKFARLTLFRFLALEIVECWPAQFSQKPDARAGLRGMFSR
ncbi:MAG: response regulator [Chthoniobacterales bacterium]